jgi:hypothetical protein
MFEGCYGCKEERCWYGCWRVKKKKRSAVPHDEPKNQIYIIHTKTLLPLSPLLFPPPPQGTSYLKRRRRDIQTLHPQTKRIIPRITARNIHIQSPPLTILKICFYTEEPIFHFP